MQTRRNIGDEDAIAIMSGIIEFANTTLDLRSGFLVRVTATVRF